MSILKAHPHANYKILFLFTDRKIKTNHLPPAQKGEGCPKKTSPVVENQKEYSLCVSCPSNSQLVDPLLLCKESRAICLWSTHVPIMQEGSEGNQSPGHCDKCLSLLQEKSAGALIKHLFTSLHFLAPSKSQQNAWKINLDYNGILLHIFTISNNY